MPRSRARALCRRTMLPRAIVGRPATSEVAANAVGGATRRWAHPRRRYTIFPPQGGMGVLVTAALLLCGGMGGGVMLSGRPAPPSHGSGVVAAGPPSCKGGAAQQERNAPRTCHTVTRPYALFGGCPPKIQKLKKIS